MSYWESGELSLSALPPDCLSLLGPLAHPDEIPPSLHCLLFSSPATLPLFIQATLASSLFLENTSTLESRAFALAIPSTWETLSQTSL